MSAWIEVLAYMPDLALLDLCNLKGEALVPDDPETGKERFSIIAHALISSCHHYQSQV